jgi:hypothetical protein
MTMARGGVLTGTVYDEFGDPAVGASVRVLRYALQSGRRTLVSAGSVSADDRGIYRLATLVPAEYVISAVGREVANTEFLRIHAAEEERRAFEADLAVRERLLAVTRAASTVPVNVVSTAPPDPVDAYATVFFPGSANSAAAVSVVLGAGEERTGLDLQLRRVPVSRVSGTLISPPGTRMVSEMLLVDRANVLPGQGVRYALLQPNGAFAFTGVPPGEYTLVAFGTLPVAGSEPPTPPAVMIGPKGEMRVAPRAPAAPSETLYAMLDLATNGQPIENVTLTMQPGVEVSGSVTFEGGRPADLTKASLRLARADTEPTPLAVEQHVPAPATLDARGRFSFRGVIPGHYRVVAGAGLTGLTLKSAVFAGRDALDFSLEAKPGEDVTAGVVTVTAQAAEIAGSLTDATGAAAPDHTVILFAADSRYWTPQSRRIQAARPATDGRFTFRNLPAGDYRLVAVSDVEPGQWFVADYLRELLSSSIPLTLGEGEKKAQALRISR